MIQIQIGTDEIVSVMQEMFPREYTICVQKVHISKLEGMITQGEKEADLVDVGSDNGQLHAHSPS